MYQYIHVNSYSAQASKKGKSTSTAKTISGEADRDKAYTKHIPQDQVREPTVIYGVSAGEAAKLAESRGAENKVRKDGHILLAGVISVPSDFQRWDEYKQDCVKHLRDSYGDRLKGVVEHTDEEHPHIHFYCVPEKGERFDVLHDGERARNLARAERQPTGTQNEVYKQAMKDFQVDFYEKVSKRYGLSKDGPKRERKPRAVYLAERDAAKYTDIAVDKCKDMLKSAQEQSQTELKAAQKQAQAQLKAAREAGLKQGLNSFAEENKGLINKVTTLSRCVGLNGARELKKMRSELSTLRDESQKKMEAADVQNFEKELQRDDAFQKRLDSKDKQLSLKDKEIQKLLADLSRSEKLAQERGVSLNKVTSELEKWRPRQREIDHEIGMGR